jgi:coenzyme PQQ precursor peptide PqqA
MVARFCVALCGDADRMDFQDRLHSPKQYHSPLEVIMQQSSWTTPDFEEISLNCEINSYAPVEL